MIGATNCRSQIKFTLARTDSGVLTTKSAPSLCDLFILRVLGENTIWRVCRGRGVAEEEVVRWKAERQ